MMNLKSRQEKILWLTVEETLTQMLVLEAEHEGSSALDADHDVKLVQRQQSSPLLCDTH